MSCKRATLAAALAALPFSILAAEPILTTVVVTASRDQAPPLATTVDAASVQTLRSATSDTASLLRDVPGVPRLLAAKLRPQIESFVVRLIRPNLEETNVALGRFLDANP